MNTEFKLERSKLAFLKAEVYALYYAARDPRTPLLAKVLTVLLVGYVVSPIDIIPDFIPFVGYLDELIIVPYALRYILKMIPPEVMVDARTKGVHTSRTIRKIGWIIAIGFIVLLCTVLVVCIGVVWAVVYLLRKL